MVVPSGGSNMERRSYRTFGIILIACLLVGVIPCTAMAKNEPLNTNPVQLTTNTHYDRNPSILLADDGTYWLFFTRGRDEQGIRGYFSVIQNNPYNPDLDCYDIWYKRSRSLEGLKWAPESKIPFQDDADLGQRDVAAVQTHDERIWVFASAGYGPEGGEPRGLFVYTYDGAWSAPSIITPEDLDNVGVGHIDALEYRDRTWVIFDYGYTLKATSLDPVSGWSDPVNIAPYATLGKAIEVDGTLYVAWVSMDTATPDIYLSSSSDGTTWKTAVPVAAWGNGLTNWDPVLVRDGKVFRLFWAPSDDEQFIATSSSRDPTDPASWSAPARVTTASSGLNTWWDFWPEPIPKGRNGGGTLALLYTSERNPDGTGMTDGNIWMDISVSRQIDR
jgi:hypothetical protein